MSFDDNKSCVPARLLPAELLLAIHGAMEGVCKETCTSQHRRAACVKEIAGGTHADSGIQLQSRSQGARFAMAVMHGVARLFLVAKRVVQCGVPISLGVWAVLYYALGGLGLPELMVLVGAPLMIG